MRQTPFTMPGAYEYLSYFFTIISLTTQDGNLALPPSLLFHEPYLDLLRKSHPHLNIQLTHGVLPSFSARLDISEPILSPVLRSIIRFARVAGKGLSHPYTFFYGIPFEPYDQSILLDAIKTTLYHPNSDLVVIPNVSPIHPTIVDIQRQGFISLPSFPDMVLSLDVNSFESYLSTLSTQWRNSVRRNMRKFDRDGFFLDSILVDEMCIDDLYRSYEYFYHRAKVKWYKHTKSYFLHLHQAKSYSKIIVAKHASGKIGGFISLFFDKNGVHAGRIGVNPEFYKCHAIYFRLIYGAIESAIEGKYRWISLGPTSYQFKSSLGAKPLPLVNLIKGTSPMWRILTQYFSGLGSTSLKHLNDTATLKLYY